MQSVRLVALLSVAILLVPLAPGEAAPLDRPFTLDWQGVLGTGRIEIPGGPTLLLETPLDIRADGFRAVVQSGFEERELPVAPHLFQGSVRGVAGSFVVASVSPDGVVAYFVLPGEPPRLLAPLAVLQAAPPSPWHILLPASPPDVIDDGGLEAPPKDHDEHDPSMHESNEAGHGHAVTASNAAAAPDLVLPAYAARPARVMVDVDERYWSYHSCVVSAQTMDCPEDAQRWARLAEHKIGVLDVLYRRQSGVGLEVTELHAWRTPAAPYPYGTGITIDVANELPITRDYWESVRPTRNDARDLLHLMSGRTAATGFIGYAYINVVASAWAYGVSAVPGFTPRNYVLVAHEIGHNFNGVHEESDGPRFSLSPLTLRPMGTIMQPTICNCWEFSDGSSGAHMDNAGRIHRHAKDRLG